MAPMKGLILVCGIVLLAGCTSVKRNFPDTQTGQVWAALVTVAETPVYDDWTVEGNDVWVDEPEQRIEIYRRLARTIRPPEARPYKQHRTWRFQVRLEDRLPPRAVFVSRGLGVPIQAQEEANRYFDQVFSELGDRESGTMGARSRGATETASSLPVRFDSLPSSPDG